MDLQGTGQPRRRVRRLRRLRATRSTPGPARSSRAGRSTPTPSPSSCSHEGVDPGYEAIISDVAVGDLESHRRACRWSPRPRTARCSSGTPKANCEPGWPQVCDTGVDAAADTASGAALHAPAHPGGGSRRPGPVRPGGNGPARRDRGRLGRLHPRVAAEWLEPPRLAGEGADARRLQTGSGYELIERPEARYGAGRRLSGRADRSHRTWSCARSTPRPKAKGCRSRRTRSCSRTTANGTPMSGWPVKLPGTIEYYGSAQEFLTEGTSTPVAADPTGTRLGRRRRGGRAQLHSSVPDRGEGHDPRHLRRAPVFPFLSEVPTSFTTTGAFGKVGDTMSFSIGRAGRDLVRDRAREPQTAAERDRRLRVRPSRPPEGRHSPRLPRQAPRSSTSSASRSSRR